MTKTLGALFLAMAMIGCGGSGTGGGGGGGTGGSGGGGDSTSCTGTLSGAVTASFTCSTALLAYDTNKNVTGMVLNSPSPPAPISDVTIEPTFTGMPASTTYTSSMSGAGGSVHVSQMTSSSSIDQWDAIAASSNNGMALGTWSLTLTSTTVTVNAGSAIDYEAHGSLTATLPGVAPTTGTVNLTVSF